jgi:hypothetical protein
MEIARCSALQSRIVRNSPASRVVHRKRRTALVREYLAVRRTALLKSLAKEFKDLGIVV